MSTFYEWNPTVGFECTNLVPETNYCVSILPGGAMPDDDEEDDNDDSGNSTSVTTATATTITVSTPTPIQTGTVSNCDQFYKVQSGDGCSAIANQYSIALDDFYAWNPAVKTDCSGLQADVYVCIGIATTATPVSTTVSSTTTTTGIVTPTPVQTGMVSNCNEFYDVGPGDGCWAIANEYGISLDNF